MIRCDLRSALLLLVGFGFILSAAFAIDQPVARLMGDNGQGLTDAARFVSWFGQGGVILYPTGLIVLIGLALRRAKLLPAGPGADLMIRNSALIFAVVAAAGLTNDVLKITFGRARPFLWLKGDDSGFQFFRYGAKFASFPSGHTATSFTAALIFSALFPRGRVLFFTFAILIAASRIVSGAHYPSDVVGGAAVGAGVAFELINRARARGWMPHSDG